MKTESNPTLGTPVSAVRGFRENGALRAIPRKVMTARNRFFGGIRCRCSSWVRSASSSGR